MDVFLPDQKEYVAAILNGWYIHYSFTFPPSPYILPLFVGTHFNSDATIFGDYSYLDGYATEYLNMYEPIGCRDWQTANILGEKGIESYFSGCLTLTLQKFGGVTSNHTVFLTDVPPEIKTYIDSLLPDKPRISLTHRFTAEETGWQGWQKREERIELFLKRYQGADLVVTTRLHCALPCIALGTPVILVVNRNEDYYDRIECFSQFCFCFSKEEILGGKADGILMKPVENKKPENMIHQMQKILQDFISDCMKDKKDTNFLPDLSLYQDLYIKRSQCARRAAQVLLQRQYNLEQQYNQDMEKVRCIMERLKNIQI